MHPVHRPYSASNYRIDCFARRWPADNCLPTCCDTYSNSSDSGPDEQLLEVQEGLQQTMQRCMEPSFHTRHFTSQTVMFRSCLQTDISTQALTRPVYPQPMTVGH
eukprot:350834-Chlamydomonas_euryale.AAC.6